MESNTGYVLVSELWLFMCDAGIGVAHVADMKERAKGLEPEGFIPFSKIGDVIGDPQLECTFMQSRTGKRSVPALTPADCDG